MRVKAGKFSVPLGPNGAGKTTPMRILTTHLKPTSVEAYVFGPNVLREGPKVRRLINYFPQQLSACIDVNRYGLYSDETDVME